MQRMTIPEILENDWFKKDYKPAQFKEEDNINLDDVDAVFNNSKVRLSVRSLDLFLSNMKSVLLFIQKIVLEKIDCLLRFLIAESVFFLFLFGCRKIL